MGNRAVITSPERELGVYLHWNGGRGSVEGFLKYCELQGYRGLGDDYGFSRLCQVIGNFFGGTTSVGIQPYTTDKQMDPGDNGIYIVQGWDIVDRIITEYDEDWKPVGVRKFNECEEQREYDLMEFVLNLDDCMPEDCRLGKAYINAKEVEAESLDIGDKVFINRTFGTESIKTFSVVAIDGDGNRYIDQYYDNLKNSWTSNPNNRISGIVRVPRNILGE